MLITISRPGALPHQQLRAKVQYRAGQLALVAEGSSFELLRGNLPGTATLKFSGPPDVRPGDWVRVYLDGDRCNPGQDDDRPHYLGEVLNEVWEAGVGDLALRGLTERVRKAAWRGPTANGTVGLLTGLLRPYLLDVLARSALGPVTVGSVPVSPVGFRSVTPFETLGTTLDTVLPALPGGVAGVDAQARFQVQEAYDAVTLRFPRTRSERPPGRVDSYANCVRFKYTRPSGAEAVFELRLTLEVTAYGQEAWSEESLPASVTTTVTNPYGTQALRVFQSLTYPGENASMSVRREQTLPAMDPAWTGHLSDGFPTWDTTVKSGRDLTGLGPDHHGYTIKGAGPGGVGLSINEIPGPLRLQIQDGSGTVTTYAQQGPGQSTTWSLGVTVTGSPIYLRYHPADVATWRSQKGTYPPQFDLSVSSATDQPVTVAVTQPVLSVMEPTDVRFVELAYNAPAVGGLLSVRAPNMSLPAQATLDVPRYTPWRGGDTITTNAAATGVSIQTLDGVLVALTRGEDDTDTGRRVWVMPSDLTGGLVVVKGDPTNLGWTGLNVTDESGLAVYAYGLLRNRVQPARSWKGTVRSFKPGGQRIDVRGRARFDTPLGDVELDVQKATYDLGSRTVTVEAGTPWPADDAEALAGAIERVERAVVKAGA